MIDLILEGELVAQSLQVPATNAQPPIREISANKRNPQKIHTKSAASKPVKPGFSANPQNLQLSVWRVRVDGTHLTVIDPAGNSPAQMRASLVARFGDRFESMERKR